VATLVATAIGACSHGSVVTTTRPASAVTAEPPTTAVAVRSTLHGHHDYAAVVRSRADVRAEPSATATVVGTYADRNENGAPQTFLIDDERAVAGAVWYDVLLPVRPNGTTGWLRASDVRVVGLRYHLEVHLDAFRVDVFDGDRLDRSITIGVGTDQTPTPGGRYYIKELLRPPDQTTVYGHFVFGLNGFSNVLLDWPGGGVLGIHGTNDPSSIGRKASHGCIRMRNEDIEALAALLPLGTPVVVSA
jgi:lipoprotein-anchoring transpeptidase ErfK/SrfK